MSVHTDIQTLYLTVYNRPADWEGLVYWTGQIEAEGLEAVNQAFTQAPEFDALYAGQSAEQQVNTLYQHLLGRDAELGGRAYWAGKLDEGTSIAEVARFITEAAEGDDATAFEARLDNAQDETYGEIIDTLYAGYYGRAADAEGKAFWLDAMKSAEGDLEPIIEAFGNSEEYVEQYGGMETESQLDALYNKLFSRDPDPEGAAYWAGQLDSGALTLSSLAFTLAQAAAADDKEALDNNIQAAKSPEPTPEPEPEPTPEPEPEPTPEPEPEPTPEPEPEPTPEPEPEPTPEPEPEPTPEPEPEPTPEPEPEPTPEPVSLALALADRWTTGSNSISFDLVFPSVATLDDVSLQGGGALSISASSSGLGGVTTARYSISAANGSTDGTLNLDFAVSGDNADSLTVEMQGLTVNGESLGTTSYVVEGSSLVELVSESTPEPEPEPTPGELLPQLIDIDIPETIDFSDGDAMLTFSATAEDDIGIDRVVFLFDRNITYDYGAFSNASINSGWEDGDTASSTYTLRDITPNGEVGLESVWVYDVTGNRVTYGADELEEMGLSTSFEVTGGIEEDAPPQLIDIDIPETIDFSDGDAMLTFSATAEDDIGIDRVVFLFDRNITYDYGAFSNASINSGWEDGDTASSTYTLRDITPNGEVGLESVWVYDVTGNRVTYGADELEEMGLSTSFEVIEIA